MRHVAQEAVALRGDIEQPQAQPLELLAQPLEVVRALHRDRIADAAVADLVDGTVDLPQRPADHQRQGDDLEQRHRQQARRLSEEPRARLVRLMLQRGDLGIDLRVALLRHFVDESAEGRELPG